ncbi:hypothetical protein Tco_1083942, partial [Tanacetum coccineum]
PPVNGGIDGQRWRSTTVNGGEPPLTSGQPPPDHRLTTSQPPPDHRSTTGQRWLTTSQQPGLDRVMTRKILTLRKPGVRTLDLSGVTLKQVTRPTALGSGLVIYTH